ncbi:hypothetical protein HD553DRAFT_326720 [Filobasidium floriforme]|uniref:uncharacterized protein n=1 Tax=Filobasidium floriforme TaxID=5210 RepID=UPI001E8D0C30|nr:uncharacterized protein HD553DRAFT_326720 [Filobasidium floriforme]KAH8079016.1 hypothetical protein HD553DRAFT_326720 [Filobasidium floriforme]
MYYFTSFKQHGLSSQQDKISTSSTPSLLPSYTRVPKKQRVIPFLSYEGSDPLTRYILVTLTFPAEKPEREDKAGEVACENARRLEDMVNDQSMETEDVQNGASGSVAFKPVEVDELTELDKAGIDNSTDKAGVDNSTESKELGADNLMELDKVEMTKSMQLESVGADNLMDLDKVEEVVESIESEGTGAGNLMEPENMEDDKVTAEFDNQDHHNARLSSTTNNRSNRNSPWYRKRNGKNGQKKETDVQVRDPLTEPAGLAGPGLSTSEVRVSEIFMELGKQRQMWLSSNSVSLRNIDPEALLKMGLIMEMEKDQIVNHKQAIKRFCDLKENVDWLSQLWTDTGSSQPLDIETMLFLEELVPEVRNLLEMLPPGISSNIESGGNTQRWEYLRGRIKHGRLEIMLLYMPIMDYCNK